MDERKGHLGLTKEKTKPLTIIILLVLGILGITAVLLISSTGKSYVDVLSSSISFRPSRVTMVLTTPDSTIKPGETTDINVILNPYKKSIQNAFVAVHFDPALVRVDAVNAQASDKVTRYLDMTDTVFKDVRDLVVDNQKGVISFSATVDEANLSKGTGKVAGFTLKGLKSGSAKLSMIVGKEPLDETGVFSSLKVNVLESVKDVTITILDK